WPGISSLRLRISSGSGYYFEQTPVDFTSFLSRRLSALRGNDLCAGRCPFYVVQKACGRRLVSKPPPTAINRLRIRLLEIVLRREVELQRADEGRATPLGLQAPRIED